MIWTGAIGTSLGVLCCVTPFLPIVLGAIGAGSIIGFVYSDAVLLPFVGVSVLVLAVGLWRRQRV